MKIEEAQPFLEFLGIDITKANSVDELKAAHTGSFISKNNIETEINADKELQGKIFGKRLGTAQTKLIQGFKANGIEFKPDEIQGKQLEDIFELGIGKQVSLAAKAIEDAKGAAGEPAKAVKEWQDKYTQLETKFNGEVQLKQAVQNEYEGYKTTVATEKKTGKVKSFVSEAWNGFKWANGTPDLVKKGFQSTIQEKYQIQLDEKDEPFVTDHNGERLKSSKKAGEWKSFNEVLEEEGMAAKVYAAANNKGSGAPAPRNLNPNPNPAPAPAPGTPEPFVHPSARKAAEV